MTVLPALVDARSKDESLSLALSRMLAEHEQAVQGADDDPHAD